MSLRSGAFRDELSSAQRIRKSVAQAFASACAAAELRHALIEIGFYAIVKEATDEARSSYSFLTVAFSRFAPDFLGELSDYSANAGTAVRK